MKSNTIIDINSNAPAGQPAATLDLPLPIKAVGKSGFLAWNWRRQALSTSLITDGVATPTKKILPPFADTIPPDSFTGATPWPDLNAGGLIALKINGVLDQLSAAKRAHHGSIPIDSAESEIVLEPRDDQVHWLTPVLAGGGRDECNVRISLTSATGDTDTVAYRQLLDADAVLRFRFQGKVTLKVLATSCPQNGLHYTQVGPTVLFLD